MYRILVIVFCMLWSVVGLVVDVVMLVQSCVSFGEVMVGFEDNFCLLLEGEVIDKGCVYFYSVLCVDCVIGVFVIFGDFIIVYKLSGEWLNVMYVV